MKIYYYLVSFLTLLLLVSCAEKKEAIPREVARSIIEESKTVELFIAGVNSSIQTGSDAHKRFSEIPKSEIEKIWLDLYVEELDIGTLLDIKSFLDTKEGKEWVEIALSQARGENPEISPAAQSALSKFTSSRSGQRWVTGMQSFTPKIMATVLEKMKIEQGGGINSEAAPLLDTP